MLILFCLSLSQAEMAGFLNFMLYNEECLSENLENFLQKKSKCRVSKHG